MLVRQPNAKKSVRVDRSDNKLVEKAIITDYHLSRKTTHEEKQISKKNIYVC